jgi:hypothetical protein
MQKRLLSIYFVLAFILVLGFVSSGVFEWTGKVTASVCGNGVLENGELCDYAGSGEHNIYGDQCTNYCWIDGTENGWNGCRGSGAGVCVDLVNDLYYENHPFFSIISRRCSLIKFFF